MNHFPQDEQAQRLKQILFPKKPKSSRISMETSIDYSVKQNYHSNGQYDLKQQISLLKEGINNFMQRQPLSDNLLVTPRQCLELIKGMTDKMTNYYEEIQEAVSTLIESIPKPIAGVLPCSKYFLTNLKISYLFSIFQIQRKRVLGKCFYDLKHESTIKKENMLREEEFNTIQNFRRQKLYKSKLAFGFNRWRVNTCLKNKIQQQQGFLHVNLTKELKTIKLLSEEGKMVLWLQKTMQSKADALQILLYDQQTSILRSYKLESQLVTSVFQAVVNQSQVSNLDESFLANKSKIKRLDITLEHSLTKICLMKKQCLVIKQLKKDPDYSQIDDFTCLHGLSARQMAGGCILTPILAKGKAIGVLRQYYYQKIGQILHPDTIKRIGETLQATLQTSIIFENLRENSLSIRNRFYLKAVLIINYIESLQVFNPENQQRFYQLLQEYFSIKLIEKYLYEAMSSLDKHPKFMVTNPNKQSTDLKETITALVKIHQSQNDWIYQGSTLYVKLCNKVFVFDVLKNDGEEMEYVPTAIIKQLLEKKEIVQEKREKEFEKSLMEKKRLEMERQIAKHEQTKKQILNFFAYVSQKQVTNWEGASSILKQFVNKFISNSSQKQFEFQVLNKPLHKAEVKPSQSLQIFKDGNLQIHLTFKQKHSQIPEQILTPLKDLALYCLNKISKKSLLKFDPKRLDLLASTNMSGQDIDNNLKNLIANYLNILPNEVSLLRISKQQNPFEDSTYCCYMEPNFNDLGNPKAFLKSLKHHCVFEHQKIFEMSTVFILDSEVVVCVNLNLNCPSAFLQKLLEIYQNWKLAYNTIHNGLSTMNKQQNFIKGFKIFQGIVTLSKIKSIFYQIKNRKIKIRSFPNLLEVYKQKQNSQLLNFGFMSLKRMISKRNTTDFAKIQKALKTFIYTIYKFSNFQMIFQNWRNHKKQKQIVNRLSNLIHSKINNTINQAFMSILFRKNFIDPNNLQIFQLIRLKSIQQPFELIKRFSQIKHIQNTSQTETECTIISKLDCLQKISDQINKKFNNFKLYLNLQNGKYLSLSNSQIQVCESIKSEQGFQYCEFNSQNKSHIKSAIWLVPQNQIVTLIEKHYLQVLSRAISDGFSKFIVKNQQFFNVINSFTKRKINKIQTNCMNNLKQHSLQRLKAQEFQWRDAYYETSIQVQNYKLIQKQHKKEQQERQSQIEQVFRQKKCQEEHLESINKKIVKLEVSSNQLEANQVQTRKQLFKKQIKRVFQLWRVDAAQNKKKTNQKMFLNKSLAFGCNRIAKLVKNKTLAIFFQSFKRIIIKSADIKAKNLSTKKKVVNHALQERHQNRLLTFQDQELHEFICAQAQKEEKEQKKVTQKQVNIIPISFKHYSQSVKQNYDVTDEQAKRMNEGAYKLNSKTLKFLKRMGKLSQ